MYQLETYRGIFIQSEESNKEFIKACIRELQPVCNSPIKRVLPYTGNGVQMYFEEQKTVLSVLRRKVLLVSGKRYHICPLVTHLTIHKVIPTTEHDIQKKLSDKLQRYLGPVLKINELPVSEEYPAIGSGNWRVIIEIPELEALKVLQNFQKKNKNSSNETSIEFYYAEDGMKLSFFCPKCGQDGHVLQHCKMLFKRKIKRNVNKPSVKNIRSNTSFQKDAVASTSTARNTSNIRRQTSRETIEQPREACSTSMNKPSKRSSEDDRNTLRVPSFSQPVTIPPTKKLLPCTTVKSESRSDDDRNILRASSFSQRITTPPTKTTHSSVTVKSESKSKDVQNTSWTPFFSQRITTSPIKHIVSSVTVKNKPQSEGVGNILRIPSFNQLATPPPAKNILPFVTVKSKPQSEDIQNTSSASSCSQPIITSPTRNIHSSVPVNIESQNPGRRNSVIGEIKILPNSRIDECIRKTGGTCRLSQPELENFLNHVKGKKNIFRILKIYTEIHKISEKALRQQLNEIVPLYHVSRLPETKEDKTLIKWLGNLVERLNKKLPEQNRKKTGPEKSRKGKPKGSIFRNIHIHT
ncbi:hypothetical protein X975_20032, partial [Stegodyphus mimosarum]